ncbi:pre-60S factor rei1 [Sporothrix curviconia]|uniref:Pre-60S factor rei1 n=1 Tax=Sporothrix curviconia TaxID=1260050 RepID=A0ABP0BTC1_9PEZI
MTTIAGNRPATKPVDESVSHQFACNSCQVAFRNADLQKSHMKGEWHRYNLKRRVVSLPPISSELFAEKALQNSAGATAEAGRVGFERTCEPCKKTYFSENSYRNHISSQKHKAQVAKGGAKRPKGKFIDDASTVISSTFSLGEPIRKSASTIAETETVGSDAEEEFSHVVEGLKKTTIEDGHSPVKRPANPRLSAAAQRKEEHLLDAGASKDASEGEAVPETKTAVPAHSLKLCLFCNFASPTVELSVAHMGRFHNMFIPEKQYLVDLEGLLTHLEKRVRDDHACITCGKVRGDVFAVQTHMRDKAHCSIPYLTIEEQVDIGDFYDFRGTYSDGEEDEDEEDDDEEDAKQSSGGAKLGAKRATRMTTSDGEEVSDDGEDDGWETDSSASSLDSADLTAVPADNSLHQYERLEKHPHHSQTDPRAHHQVDGWHSHAHKHNHAVYYDEHELHLPSGRSVGHRSLNKYYRQNLRSYPSLAEREKQIQLAIEAGVEFDDDDEEEDETTSEAVSSALARQANAAKARAVSTRPMPRNLMGLTGVTDKAKLNLLKVERRHEMAQMMAADKGRIKFSANSIGQSFRFLGRT